MITGNQSNQGSFLDVMLALKNNVMRDLNVAEVVEVKKISTNSITVSVLTNPQQMLECVALQNLDVQLNDIMLVIFTNTDFRTNLNKFKNNQTLQKIDNQTMHTKNTGVLVGLIYRKEN